MVVDRHRDRSRWPTRSAPSRSTIPHRSRRHGDAETNGLGADRGCECVGYQAHDPQGHEHPNASLNKLVRSVRFTGTISMVVYVPADPGGPDELARRGEVAFDFGLFWFKGQAMGTGQCPVKRYNRHLRELVHTGKAHPSLIISHELPLERAPEATSTSTHVTTAGPR